MGEIRLLTAEEILATPDAPVGRRASDAPPSRADVQHVRQLLEEAVERERAIRREIAPILDSLKRDLARASRECLPLLMDVVQQAQQVAYERALFIEESRKPGVPDLAWALMAMLDRGQSGLYCEDDRNLAAGWIAERLGRLPGDPRARAEVRRGLRQLARREGRDPETLLRELVLAAAPEAALRVGRRLAYRRREDSLLRTVFAYEILGGVRRILRAEFRGENRLAPECDALLAAALTERVSDRDLEVRLAVLSSVPLSPRQREIVAALRENEGSIEAAADQLGLASSGVRHQLARIRKKIATACRRFPPLPRSQRVGGWKCAKHC